MNQLFKLTLLSLVLVISIGCDREKEKIPAYLHIKKFTFTTTPDQGLNTSEISAAIVFADGQEVGTFELPVTVPIVQLGNIEITLIPCIKENGSSNYHLDYKPYQSYTTTMNLEERKVDTVQPSAKYRDNTKFDWMEDFDGSGIKLERYGLNNTNDSLQKIRTNLPGVNQPFTGSAYCGLIDIAPTIDAVDFERSTTPGWLSLPNLGTDVYVEMDYKSNMNIQVGLYIFNGSTVSRVPVLFTYPTENWKKIYINLKSELGDLPSSSTMKIFFGVYKEYGDITTDPLVYLDNLKLVYVN